MVANIIKRTELKIYILFIFIEFYGLEEHATGQNFSVLMKIALNLLKNEKSEKQGIKGKRLKAAYDNEYLIKLLNLKV